MEFSLQAALIRSRLKPELQTSAQKWILTINCMMRGSRAPLTVPKPVDVVDGAVRFEVQVGRRRIRQAGEIERGIDAAELGVVEHVEGVGPELRRLPSRRARLFWSGRFVLLTPGVRR